MSNMSYCRFENTVGDLQECYAAMDEQDLSESEMKARKQLLETCVNLAADYGHELED